MRTAAAAAALGVSPDDVPDEAVADPDAATAFHASLVDAAAAHPEGIRANDVATLARILRVWDRTAVWARVDGATRRRATRVAWARLATTAAGGGEAARAAAVRALARAVDDWDDDVDDVDDTSDDSHPTFDDSRSTRVTTSSDARAIRDAAVAAGDFPAAAKFALILPATADERCRAVLAVRPTETDVDDALVRLILVRGLLPRLRDAPGGAGLALFDAVTSRLTRGPDAAATTIPFAVGSLAAARMYADAGHLAMEVARMHPALRSGDAAVATLERFLRAGARREAAGAAREEKEEDENGDDGEIETTTIMARALRAGARNACADGLAALLADSR